MTYCEVCGKPSGVALLGAHDSKYECRSCNLTIFGGRRDSVCPRCKNKNLERIGNIGDNEQIPGGLCSDCEEHRKVAAAGGILFRCCECHTRGAIRASSKLAQDVRAQLGVKPPKLCGLEFPTCAEHERIGMDLCSAWADLEPIE